MALDQRFENMGAVVTGGASGMGSAVARRMVAEGGQVTLWDVEQARLDKATAELGKQSRGTRVDVTDPGEVERAAKEAETAMGHVDVLVCSAGVAGANALVINYPIDEWKRVIDINLNGLFYCNRFVANDEGARLRTHRQHLFDRRQGREPDGVGLQRLESGGHRAHQVARQGTRQGRRLGQRRYSGDDRDADPRTSLGGAYRLHALEDSDGALRHGRRSRGADLLAGEPRMLVLDRRGL